MKDDLTVLDVKDFIWRILCSWKVMLLFVLVLGLLMSGLFYYRDLKGYNDQIAAEKAMNKGVTDEEKEEMLSSLTDSDRKKIESLLSASKTIERLQNYMDSSLLMQLDPFNMDVLELDYMIAGDEGISSDIGAIVDSYRRFVRSNDFLITVQDAFTVKADRNSINEMIQFDNSSTYEGVQKVDFFIKIILPSGVDSKSVLKSVKSAINDAQKRISKKTGEHTLACNNKTITKNTDINLSQNRMNIENTILNMSNTSGNILANLSSETLSVYNKLAISEKNKRNPNSKRDYAAPPKPGISKKKCIVSFAVAFILYAMIWFIYSLIKGLSESAASASDNLDSKCIGEAYYKGERKGIKALLTSDAVLAKRFGSAYDSEEQADAITKSIKNRLKFEDVKDIALMTVGHGAEGSIGDCIKSIGSTLKRSRIKVKDVEFELNGNVAPDETSFVDMKNAVPVVIGSKTTNREIASLRSLLKDYEVNVPGIVYLEEF